MMDLSAKSFTKMMCWLSGTEFQQVSAPMPALPPGGGLLRVEACGVCGSDAEKMQSARVPSGTVLGHEVMGTLVALDAAYEGHFSVGQRIVSAHHVPCSQCDCCTRGHEPMCAQFKQTNITPGGFASHIALSAQHLQHVAFAVPPTVSDAQATCVEPLACVLRGLDRMLGHHDFVANTKIGVVGLGFIGQLAVQSLTRLLLFPPTSVLAVDPQVNRQAIARQSCPGVVVNGAPEAQQQCDAIFLSAVTPVTVSLALNWLKPGGTLLLFAGQAHLNTLDLSTVYFQELTVMGSYSPSLQHLKQAADAVFRQRLSLDPLLTQGYPLSQCQQAVEAYCSGKAIKTWLVPD